VRRIGAVPGGPHYHNLDYSPGRGEKQGGVGKGTGRGRISIRREGKKMNGQHVKGAVIFSCTKTFVILSSKIEGGGTPWIREREKT